MLDEEQQVYDLLDEAPYLEGKTSSKRTVTRRELARSVFLACDGLAHRHAAVLVDQVLEEISEVLVAGESVTLCNFGKFLICEKKERKGRNPRTGAFAVVRPRKVVSFRAAKHLKVSVTKGASQKG